MDPFLEDAKLWPTFHRHLVQSFRDLLLPGLMNSYRAGLAERHYILSGAEQREAYVEIRQSSDGRLITVLEVISPANKSTEAGRHAYLATRQEIRAAHASLVEIDLLLQGQPLQDYAREGLPDWDYMVTVTRSVQPDRYEIYTTTLDKRLPRFRLPLAADDRDTVLDLQAAVVRSYDQGDFATQIDYRRLPPAPLKPEQAKWLQERLAAYRKQSPPEPFISHDDIARLAHQLWERAGRPHGRAQEHWQQAIEELKRQARKP